MANLAAVTTKPSDQAEVPIVEALVADDLTDLANAAWPTSNRCAYTSDLVRGRERERELWP